MTRTALPWALAFALTAVPARAAPNPASEPRIEIRIPYTKHTLRNGLEVISHSDRSVPAVAVSVWYHVGPANEPAHRSGFAHLFEHLMFEGSRHVPPGQFDRLMESAGATDVNGTTSWDRTNYFETVPPEHLERALWIESDRMGFLLDAISLERLNVQRGVVENERRQSFENAPYGPSSLVLYDLLFPKGHPYHGAIIGAVEDIRSASLSDVREFHERYYAPSNATLTLAGNFEPKRALELVRKYFGSLRSRPAPPRATRVTPPLSKSVQRVVREGVDLPKVAIAWLAPPAFHRDHAALEVARTILADGKTARLYRALVVPGTASSIDATFDSNQLCSVLEIDALAAKGVGARKVDAEIAKVLATLSREGPSEAEVRRAKRKLAVRALRGVQQLNAGGGDWGRAGILQRFNHYTGDPGFYRTFTRRIAAVSRADVKRVLAAHASPERRAAVWTIPRESK